VHTVIRALYHTAKTRVDIQYSMTEFHATADVLLLLLHGTQLWYIYRSRIVYKLGFKYKEIQFPNFNQVEQEL